MVLAALVFSKHLFDADALARAVLAFVVFCALAGAVYLVNDLVDLERDRLHPAQADAADRERRAAVAPARGRRRVLFAGRPGRPALLGPPFLDVRRSVPRARLAYSLRSSTS